MGNFDLNTMALILLKELKTNKEGLMSSETQLSRSSQSTSQRSNVAHHSLGEQIYEDAHEYATKAREIGKRAINRGSEIVKENPGYSLLGAAAIGFLAGAYIARRK
jgi:ElaB/YqjD/DUF883 family membrane-anchored ribosome-binding protein